jgi:hypothetical protein
MRVEVVVIDRVERVKRTHEKKTTISIEFVVDK